MIHLLSKVSPLNILVSYTRSTSKLIINSSYTGEYKQKCLFSSTRRTYSDNKDFKPSEELAKERYDIRANEDIDKKRARLLYQSRKRGMLENGVILSSFADKYLNKLDPNELDQYDRLINLPTNDWDIFYWATKTKPTPAEFETPVMAKLREHLHSKVSSESDIISRGPSLLDNKRSDDIVMPRVKTFYPYNVDIHETDLTNYEEELFDNRTIKVDRNTSMLRMTDWRKNRFVKRIRRSISSPVSVRNLSDDKQGDLYTQNIKESDKNIAKHKIMQDNLEDTDYERAIKHHNFLQHLTSSNFTDDALDYDDEVKAWASAIWHRNYGTADVNIAPVKYKCISCKSKLHCCDPGLDGYIPKERFSTLYNPNTSKNLICQRCNFSNTYGANISPEISDEQFKLVISDLKNKPTSVVCILVDLTDFPSGIYPDIIDMVGIHHKIIVVGNKLDLLPYDGLNMIERVQECLKKNINRLRCGQTNLYVNDLMVLSARTGFGVESLVTRILSYCNEPKDVYIIGSNNSGKSTLFNSLLQSDLCAIRDCDLISRVSKSEFKCNIRMLKFPINKPEGWEIVLKERRLERVERNTALREKSFLNTTKFRQATLPHISMLIDRLEYLPRDENKLTDQLTCSIDYDHKNIIREQPMFADDHPLKHLKSRPPLSATEKEFPHHAFCHQLPSTKTNDQIHDLLTNDERLEVFPHETIKPRKYSLRPLQSIFIAGLARLDLVTSNSNVIITIFASRYLPVHVIATKKSDQFYNTFLGSSYLGVPFGDEERMKGWPKKLETNNDSEFLIRGSEYHDGSSDIVFGSIGWALINVGKDQDCIVRAYTPKGRGIFCRNPPLVMYGRSMVKGKKIRDTPLFRNRDFNLNYISQN